MDHDALAVQDRHRPGYPVITVAGHSGDTRPGRR